MSLEARIELLTAAVIELTAAIGTMQAPAPIERPKVTAAEVSAERYANGGTMMDAKERVIKAKEEVPNAPSKSTDTTPGEPSAPTGESSSPETQLDYVKDVKPITIRLSKEKGRETTIAVLQRFGVKGAQELDVVQWAEYIAHCEKVLAGGEV